MRDNTYFNDPPNSRPSIFQVVSSYTSLRRVGREQQGLCPLHSEKTPSFRVNEDRGLFHCFGCGAGGDVFTFIELIEGVGFKGALSFLGMGDDPPPPPEIRQAARQISQWINEQIAKMNLRLHELDEQLELADELGDSQLAESIWRERAILASLRDDLGQFSFRKDFFEIRDVIEGITRSFE